jgi:NAD(P)-dependent dehydrogenase (short-subunit alcohol dehydrogenase family)
MPTAVPNAFDLTGQVALVTGSSSELGIGFASARLLGQFGASVMVTGTTERAAERALELAITMAILGKGATKDEAVAISTSAVAWPSITPAP